VAQALLLFPLRSAASGRPAAGLAHEREPTMDTNLLLLIVVLVLLFGGGGLYWRRRR
jgi:LPXTG-motif cell wall-anchored protein